MSLLPPFPFHDKLMERAAARKAKVYVVGGFLRNAWMRKAVCDIDFAVNADAIKLAKAFAKDIRGAFVLLDDQHGSARVVKEYVGKIWTYDFTDFRGKTLAEDLRRRDFTINAFCISLDGLENLSRGNAGRDLKEGIIRMVYPKAFVDDPLRLMRAMSLMAQTGFRIESSTTWKIRTYAHLLPTVAMERIREELFKVWQSPRAHAAICAMFKAGLLSRILPQLEVMEGVKQGGYHHLDVWKHSLLVLKELEMLLEQSKEDPVFKTYLEEVIGGGHTREGLLKFSALLHDIGKPATRKEEKRRVTFHGHEHVGAKLTRLVAKTLKVSTAERYWLEDVVKAHLRPGYLSNFKQPSSRAMFRYLRDTKGEGAAIALLAMADQRATLGKLTTPEKIRHHEAICRKIIDAFFAKKNKPVKPRLLTGHDLIKRLNLKPSPLFAEILTGIEEAQALGKVKTTEEALEMAKTICATRV